jgi:capsular polysaccharide biosynthesis protein
MLRLFVLRLLETYFRHRWLYLMPITLMLAAALVSLVVLPPKYTASSRLLVEKETLLAALTSSENNGPTWRTPAQMTTDELAELISTEAFVQAVIQRTDLQARMSGSQRDIARTIDTFRKAMTMRSLGDKLVEISAADEDPRLAQQMVSATLDAFIQWQINKNYQESVVAQQFFANVIKPYQQELQQARAMLASYLEAHPEPARGVRPTEEAIEIDRLKADVNRAELRVTNAMQNEESARLALVKAESLTRQTYVVIDSPQVPENRIQWRRLALNFTIFLGAGVALSAMAIVIGTLFDRSLRFPIDVSHSLGLPLLALVPAVPPASRRLIADEQHPERAAADLKPGMPQLQLYTEQTQAGTRTSREPSAQI